VTTSLAASSLSNLRSIETLNNQSNATLVPSPSNQSNASVPEVTNNTFDAAGSNSTVSPPLNTSSAQTTENISTTIRSDDKELSANTSSAKAIENTLTGPPAKEMNNTTVIVTTNNKININPPLTTSTQNNDTSNNKKCSEKSISIDLPKSKDQFTPTDLTKDNAINEKASTVT